MLYVMYTDYGAGRTFQTGPEDKRHRSGIWAHYYVRENSEHLRRVHLGPVVLPESGIVGKMYIVGEADSGKAALI